MVVKIERKRYFLVEFFDEIPEKGYLIHLLRKYVAELGGQLALADSAIHVVDIHDQFAIIRSTHDYRDIVEVAIQLLHRKSFISVVRTVSGTIKKINQVLETDFNDLDES